MERSLASEQSPVLGCSMLMNMFGLSVTQMPIVTKKSSLLALSASEVRNCTFYLAESDKVLVFISVTIDGFGKQLKKQHTRRAGRG